MPTTRKKTIKTVYKDDSEGETGDFSDSGSEAHISEPSSSDEEEIEEHRSSAEESDIKSHKPLQKKPVKRKPKFAKEFIGKITKQIAAETEENDLPLSQFSVKDLTDADKLLPSTLNLSESDSSDDETPKTSKKKTPAVPYPLLEEEESEIEDTEEYTDIWANTIHGNSAEIAKKTFKELEQHKNIIEETKASLQSYAPRSSTEKVIESNVTDLLALGEDVIPQKSPAQKKRKNKKVKDDSESEVEDWEEVKESKEIPKQGLQLVVALPDYVCRKSKKIDVEMMMKRKMNRVKKEHQVFMHKVHVLCWIGHGNYVSPVLNDQEIMAAVLAMVPKGCYPEDRLNMKYVEQITTWFKDKLTLKKDKYENKFRPKAPPLKTILLNQIKSRTVTANKYLVCIFVAMLRALGLQCRIMFNFVTVPLRPPSSELCSLSTKSKDEKSTKQTSNEKERNSEATISESKKADSKIKAKSKEKLPQVDGVYDSFSSSDSEFENIMQVDGNDDAPATKPRSLRATRAKKDDASKADVMNEDKIASHSINDNAGMTKTKTIKATKTKRTKAAKESNIKEDENAHTSEKGDALTAKNKNLRVTRAKKSGVAPENVNKEDLLASHTKNEDGLTIKTKTLRATRVKKAEEAKANVNENEGVSPPKRSRKDAESTPITVSNTIAMKKSEPSKSPQTKNTNKGEGDYQNKTNTSKNETPTILKSPISLSLKKNPNNIKLEKQPENTTSLRKMRSDSKVIGQTVQTTASKNQTTTNLESQSKKKLNIPKVTVTDENEQESTHSKYFESFKTDKEEIEKRLTRKRSCTTVNGTPKLEDNKKDTKPKTRTKSAPGSATEKSKYFNETDNEAKKPKLSAQQLKKTEKLEDTQRVSHKDLAKSKPKPKNDIKDELVNIIKGRIKGAKEEAKKGVVKGKVKKESDDDSDYLPVEDPKRRISESDEDFKPIKISPRAPKLTPGAKSSTSKKPLDRRVLSSDDDASKTNKIDIWCEIFVEELEQWIAVDVVKGKVHCTGELLYSNATHPVCYVVGWDNNNYLKDLTRRYVPHWNTVTRKQRAELDWWKTAGQPWLGPKNARDREEDDALDRMQLEAPLPKSIGEYKNHPLYALKRHLLKFEALYPPDATTLGFVRNEPVYARECVYTCRSRDTWLKEAKVVKMGEQPYKIVKARPKWDRLSNKMITDKPLEVFGPWQVQDYEPPTAENGMVPRNAYGNVELFKECMLPKGTVHVKLPGLNKVARKLNIDCAPAMTGFDYSGGYAHPAYDGFVVCKEFEEIITEAWIKDQEEQERKELEKIELRVYGNWKRLIKGLLIRERLKHKYGFERPSTSQAAKSKKGPRLVVKKNLK